jgi:beta-galactosidase
MGPNLPGLDTTVTRVESLPPGLQRPARDGGAVIRWQETLEGTAPVQISGEDGQPLLVGERLQYLGVWPDAELWRRIVTDAAARAGVALTPLPEGLRIRDTANFRFYFNYNPEEIEYKDLRLPSAGVSWTPLP